MTNFAKQTDPGLASRPTESPWIIYRTLVGVGVICSLLIVSVFILTGPSIQRNRAEAVEMAVFKVLPTAVSKQTFELTEELHFAPLDQQTRVDDSANPSIIYAGYDANQHLVGLAILAQGRGYQDNIRIMYGYAPDRQVIIGMTVLESRETPGLGDKIETDQRFSNNFVQLDVTLTADLTTLKNSIIAVKAGQKNNAWQIDGITGATISSQAIAKILKQSSSKWIPLLFINRHTFVLTVEGEKHG